MTRSDEQSNIDSEAGSVRVGRISKLGAVLCPAVCALLLVVIFAVSFVGSKLAIDRYGAFCTNRRYTGAKRYVFPDLNLTL